MLHHASCMHVESPSSCDSEPFYEVTLCRTACTVLSIGGSGHSRHYKNCPLWIKSRWIETGFAIQCDLVSLSISSGPACCRPDVGGELAQEEMCESVQHSLMSQVCSGGTPRGSEFPHILLCPCLQTVTLMRGDVSKILLPQRTLSRPHQSPCASTRWYGHKGTH